MDLVVQQILESGELPEEVSIKQLHTTMVAVRHEMNQTRRDASGETRYEQLKRLHIKVHAAIERLHGLDGMTHLTA